MFDRAVATVNGEEVSLRQALARAVWHDGLGFVEEAVDARIITDAAARMGITVSREELQENADAFRAGRGLHKAAEMNAWLAERGRSVAQWQEHLEEAILTRKLRRALCEPQVDDYFEEHRREFDSAVISRIVVTEQREAEELWYRVVDDGEDFHALARIHSCDAGTRPAGGRVGVVARGDLPPAVEAAVFAAHAGEVIGPMPVREGWLLLKVEEHLANVLDSAVREAIASTLFRSWLASQRSGDAVVRQAPEWL